MPGTNDRHRSLLSSEQILLVKASVCSEREARQAFVAWSSSVDLDDIDSGSYQLLPQLYERFAGSGVLGPVEGRLRSVYRRTWVQGGLVSHKLHAALTAFQDAGIEALVCGGAAIGLHHYREAALRPVTAADVVVGAADLLCALESLEAQGWQVERDKRAWRPYVRSSTFVLRQPGIVPLRLHQRIYRERLPGDEAGAWKSSQPLEFRGLKTRTLHPLDQLFSALIATTSTNEIASVLGVSDVLAILRSTGFEVDAERLWRHANEQGLMPALLDATSHLEDVFGETALQSLRRRLEAEPLRVTDRIFDWSRRRGDLVSRAIGRVLSNRTLLRAMSS